MVQEHFHELLREPLSEQHRNHFQKYFETDISKVFTVDEFGLLFQIKPFLCKSALDNKRINLFLFLRLGQRILTIFNQAEAARNNQIPGVDVIRIARIIWTSSLSIKVYILFKLFDENNNGLISINEIRNFYQHYLSNFEYFKEGNRLNEVVDTFLQGFFPEAQDDPNAEIDFDRFHQILQQNPSVLQSLYLISIPNEDEQEILSWFERLRFKIQNNKNRLVIMTLYLLILTALMIYVVVYRTVQLKDPRVFPMFARIAGIWIHFHYALAISLMLKQTLTFARRNKIIRNLIPVDDHIDAHRFVGTMLVISSAIHTFAYIIFFAVRDSSKINRSIHSDHTRFFYLLDVSWAASMFTTEAQLGWVAHSAPITGVILVFLLTIMFIFSLQWIRQRSGFFQLFQYTHYLFWPIFILLVIHAEHFWKWAIGPMIILFIEKIYMLKRLSRSYGRTRLLSVRLEDKNVITLFIQRPNNFRFSVGEYINISLPVIS